jgi:hypothetical protein
MTTRGSHMLRNHADSDVAFMPGAGDHEAAPRGLPHTGGRGTL